MLGVGLVCVFYAEVVDAKDKGFFWLVCVNSTGVYLHGTYPEALRCCLSRSLAMRPACFRPYIPFRISTNAFPFTTLAVNPYWSMISWVMSAILIHMYSYRFIGVPS